MIAVNAPLAVDEGIAVANVTIVMDDADSSTVAKTVLDRLRVTEDSPKGCAPPGKARARWQGR